MFHLKILGEIENKWLDGYGGSDYSNAIMGKWFKQCKRDVRIYLIFVNHPVHPV